MKDRTKKWLAAALSAQTLAAGPSAAAMAQDASPASVEVTQQTSSQPVAVRPGALKGAVVNPSTGKPWANTSVEIVDPSSGKVIGKTRTDASGQYDLGEVREGHYLLRINGKIELPIDVAPAAEATTLNVAVPTALMGRVAGALSWTTVSLIGAGVLTAVAVPVGFAGGGGGGGGHAVSPS